MQGLNLGGLISRLDVIAEDLKLRDRGAVQVGERDDVGVVLFITSGDMLDGG